MGLISSSKAPPAATSTVYNTKNHQTREGSLDLQDLSTGKYQYRLQANSYFDFSQSSERARDLGAALEEQEKVGPRAPSLD